MLSEEEIKDLITCALWDADERGSRNGIDNAARAIAERLREGVVWEGPGKIAKHGEILLLSPLSGEAYGVLHVWPIGELEKMPIGQHVRVTVRREGDGQGVVSKQTS